MITTLLTVILWLIIIVAGIWILSALFSLVFGILTARQLRRYRNDFNKKWNEGGLL